MTLSRRFALTAVSLVSILALAGPALADTTVTLTVGPVPIPEVPVEVCITQTDLPDPINECVTTPPADTLTLTVVVTVETPEPVLVPPAVTPIACPAGTEGVAVQVFTGSAAAAIGGSVTVIINGEAVTVPIAEVIAPAGQTLTVLACVGISPGLPALPLPTL